ncbi:MULTISPECIES: hypothetical protein [Aromatoleum]|uniref:RiboL-PSP-HEPN domain-containing protein n=2 Tax=Aromatoleum TaxID=551759 RepID=A0ABX1NWJ7_9RHOO|nr:MULTISPECIES: hypothetical protein [Aromatoleum]MCK0506516.1 hypothetical protein [Aromatoleum anaerobium]NMG16027.1 hypothetical protein [Aromatoleum bremense]QTQ31371.1 Uncharacterized protein pbN1_13796 [Aromatoleum bremense]
MRRDEIANELSIRAFEFFYWFSRFEFALKENGYLRSHDVGKKAEPGWDEFVAKWSEGYSPSRNAIELLRAPPETQVVGENSQLTWRVTELSDYRSDLAKVVRLVKTVRNNLFHGGKHGGAGWSNPSRTESLLTNATAVLDQLAELAVIEADYQKRY